MVIADVADRQGLELATELGDGALFLHLDVSDEQGWSSLLPKVVDTFGTVDVLVNNAGIATRHSSRSSPARGGTRSSP